MKLISAAIGIIFLFAGCNAKETAPSQQNIVSTVIPGESESYDQGHASPTPAITDFDKNLRAFDGTEN